MKIKVNRKDDIGMLKLLTDLCIFAYGKTAPNCLGKAQSITMKNRTKDNMKLDIIWFDENNKGTDKDSIQVIKRIHSVIEHLRKHDIKVSITVSKN